MSLYYETNFNYLYPVVQTLNDVEIFTQSTWNELLTQANRAHVPYFATAVCFLSNGKVSVYDAFFLRRHLKYKPTSLDPLTNLSISHVSYQAVKTPVDLTKKKIVFSKIAFSEKFGKPSIVIEANNFHVYDKKDQKERAASCQFICGSHLLQVAENSKDIREAVRWLTCASQNGCDSATQLLEAHKEYERSTRHARNIKLFKQTEYWCKAFKSIN